MSYHPAPFRHSNTVVLRKPLEAVLQRTKGVQTNCIAEHPRQGAREDRWPYGLPNSPKQHRLLPDTQMGARPGRSTITALEAPYRADPNGVGEGSEARGHTTQPGHIRCIRQRLARTTHP